MPAGAQRFCRRRSLVVGGDAHSAGQQHLLWPLMSDGAPRHIASLPLPPPQLRVPNIPASEVPGESGLELLVLGLRFRVKVQV
jgi:hypothetical protein